jgi:hypothetical protein
MLCGAVLLKVLYLSSKMQVRVSFECAAVKVYASSSMNLGPSKS